MCVYFRNEASTVKFAYKLKLEGLMELRLSPYERVDAEEEHIRAEVDT